MLEFNMAHYSSKPKTDPKRLEAFLIALANTTSRLAGYDRDYGPMRRIRQQFPEFFPSEFPGDSQLARDREEQYEQLAAGSLHEPYTDAERERDSLDAYIKWAELLRRAWDEPDSRKREWWLYELRRDFEITTHPGRKAHRIIDPPQTSPFELSIVRLLRRLEFAKHCANPDCNQLPYFIATNRRYKYCSEECAAPAQKAFKLEWWNKKGKTQRAKKGVKNAKKKA